LTRIVGVSFRNSKKLYNFDPGELDLSDGDQVIVETENGIACGTVSGGLQQVSSDYLKKPLRRVVRKVTEEDAVLLRGHRELEQKAARYCVDRVEARKLQMKLVDVEYLFGGSKVIFYFTADGRIDFRELVKDLATRLRTRIEMRQIGVRDEAKMLGGYGTCGREFCCCSYIQEFMPVSIKMAKQQDLTLNPSKISGVCGRLMCCLSYENTSYECFKKGLPKPGKSVMTPEGPLKVVSHNVMRGTVTVRLPSGKNVELTDGEIARLRKGLPLETVPGREDRAPETAPPTQPGGARPDAPSGAKPAARVGRKPRVQPEPKTAPEPAPEAKKEGLVSRIKKMAGGERDPEAPEPGKSRRRRRRRRRRGSKGKPSETKNK
jgi:cell fate regulator YaaT (PSP1 superfamily)